MANDDNQKTSLGRYVLRKTLEVGLALGAGYALITGINAIKHQNKVNFGEHTITATKIDGMFGYTKLKIFRWDKYSSYSVEQYHLENENLGIIDGAGYGKTDGLVDKILITPSNTENSQTLIRTKDYNSHQKEFDDADKLLKETKERFKDIFREKENDERIAEYFINYIL